MPLSFFSELKRRNVFKVAAAYIVVAWLIMQVGDVMAPAMHLPDWINSALVFFLVLGLPVALVLSWAFELTPEGVRLEKNVDRSRSIRHLTGRKLDYWMIALLVAAVGFFAFDKFVLDPERDADRIEAAVQVARQDAAPAVDTASGPSIAVLPFVNMSDDESNEYFSDGISEELLNVLAKLPGLRVAARTSAFQFKGQNRDIPEIARQLHVNHVLEGSVRKAGNRLRITAQLIEAESGFHLWSDSYDRELEDIFSIQDEISAAIAEALKGELGLSDRLDAGKLPTIPAATSAEAYELYLRGRQLTNARNPAALEEAVIALEHALDLDEQYAPAQAQLAIAITLQDQGEGSHDPRSIQDVWLRATRHADRAMELGPNLAEAYGARALIASANFEFLSAIENGKKALALNPSYVDAMNWVQASLVNTGQWIEAMQLMDRMAAADPLSIVGRINYTFKLGRQRRFSEARQIADELGAQSPRGRSLAYGLISGDYEGAITESNRSYLSALSYDVADSFARRRLAVNFANIGLFEEARRLAPEWDWLVSAYEQSWPRAIALTRTRLAEDPQNNGVKFELANLLHMSGDFSAAQVIYQELFLINPGFPLNEPATTSPMAMARMAFGAKIAGDDHAAAEALELLRLDQQEREAAGILESYLRCAARPRPRP